MAFKPLLLPVSESMQQDATQQQHNLNAPPVLLRSSFDEHMSHAYPNHQPASQEVIRLKLYAMGATNDTLLECMERQNQYWDDVFAQAPNGRPFPVLGVCHYSIVFCASANCF